MAYGAEVACHSAEAGERVSGPEGEDERASDCVLCSGGEVERRRTSGAGAGARYALA